eukprot:4196625-Prymnesium_polylepis.1
MITAIEEDGPATPTRKIITPSCERHARVDEKMAWRGHVSICHFCVGFLTSSLLMEILWLCASATDDRAARLHDLGVVPLPRVGVTK